MTEDSEDVRPATWAARWKSAARSYFGLAEIHEATLVAMQAELDRTRKLLKEAHGGMAKLRDRRAKWKRRAHKFRGQAKALRALLPPEDDQ